jgi:hypothetical protein
VLVAMSVLPLLVLGAAVLGLAVFGVVLVLHFSRQVSRVASVVAAIVIIGTGLFMALAVVNVLSSDNVTVTVPVGPLPPHVDPGVEIEPTQATILSGGFDQATVTVSGLTLPTRVLLLLSVIVPGATEIGVALVLRRLARSVGAGDPFRLGGDALVRTAWIVLAGGMVSSLLEDVASWRASAEVFFTRGWSADDRTAGGELSLADLGWPDPAGLQLHFPFWPLAAGLVLALLAAVFRQGEQLRHDAAGLV